MALQMRRVITGHDATGRAIVKIDAIVENSFVGRPGATVYPVWSTEGFPVDNDGQADEGLRVWEVNCPDRSRRRRKGKSDPVDAENAARAVLAGEATAVPRDRRG